MVVFRFDRVADGGDEGCEVGLVLAVPVLDDFHPDGEDFGDHVGG